MVWNWAASSKIAVIKTILAESKHGDYNETTREELVDGNIVWAIRDVKDSAGKLISAFIQCSVLEPSNDGWGWNTTPEEGEPFYYSVPMAWVQKVPIPKGPGNEGAKAWRQTVEHLANQAKPKTVIDGYLA